MSVSEQPSVAPTLHERLVRVERDAGRTVLSLGGEHDLCTAGLVAGMITQAIALDDADLVFDLSGVDYMDVATVRMIVAARNSVGLGSRSVTLRSPSRCARRIFGLCGHADLLGPEISPALSRLGTTPARVGAVAGSRISRQLHDRSEAVMADTAVAVTRAEREVDGLWHRAVTHRESALSDRLVEVSHALRGVSRVMGHDRAIG